MRGREILGQVGVGGGWSSAGAGEAPWMEGGSGMFDMLIQEKRRSVTLLSYTRRWT